jgi:hypothetical protein
MAVVYKARLVASLTRRPLSSNVPPRWNTQFEEARMAGWRTWGSVAVVLALTRPAAAQTYLLAEPSPKGKYFQVSIDMTLAGEVRFAQDGKQVPVKQNATARHVFTERVLDVGPAGLARKCAQYYRTAKATITLGKNPSERTLRPERRLLIAQRPTDQGLIYSPIGPLTREEVDLTEHFDTLSLSGLLPGKAVAVRATWKPANAVVQALCNFEGLTSQDLMCKLERVHGNVAEVSFKGKAAGIDTGALVKLTVQGACRFDRKVRRLIRLEWRQDEQRDQGPVSPASAAKVAITLTRTPAEPAKELSDVALAGIPESFEPPPILVQVSHVDPDKRFELLYSRDWKVVGQTDRHLILRLMDRGDFIAQATIAPWTREEPGKHLTPEAFQQAMADTPGWEPEQVLQAAEVPSETDADSGRWVYRITALGKLDGVKVMQNFFVIASPKGEQVVVTFTMTPGQAQKIGTRDLALVGSLSFPSANTDGLKKQKP